MIQGYLSREKRVYEQELRKGQWTAWHVAAYVGMSFGGDKLPDLNDILTKPIFDDKAIIEKSELVLSEEEQYKQSRNYIKSLIKAGINVKPEILTKYDL